MDEDKLFSDVRFVLASQCDHADDIKNILIEGGAKHINYLSEHVTHVIADSNCLEAEEAVELYDKPVVGSLWVYLSSKAKKLLPTEAFSPTKRYFQNVFAFFSKDLSSKDMDTLAATVTFYGGNITRSLDLATHFIALSSSPSDLPVDKPNLKTVAPDWILDSIKQRQCCDELFYDPGLLLGPPPPTPPPPKEPEPPEEDVKEAEAATRSDNPSGSVEENKSSGLNSPSKQTQVITNSNLIPSHRQPQSSQVQQQPSFNQQQQQSQYQQPNLEQPSQIPRPRMTSNIARGVSQPRFRPILPAQTPNLPNSQPRSMRPQTSRLMQPDHQQALKPNIYNQDYRKVSPYQNNVDPNQQPQLQQQQQPQVRTQLPQQPQPQHQIPQQNPQGYPNQHVPMHQQGSLMNQAPSRIPQPNNVYHHSRGPYPNNHIGPRQGMPLQSGVMGQAPPPMMNQAQQQQQHQPPHMMNRFQDPNHMPQRPYQVCAQPPQPNPGYQQGNMPRQQMYYAQNANQNQMRIPQPGPMMRPPIHPDQMMHESQVVYNQQHPSHDPMQSAPHQPPQHYQVRHPHPGYQHPPQQQHMPPQPLVHQYQPAQQQHSPQLQQQPQPPGTVMIQPSRPPFHQPSMPASPGGPGLRPPRNIAPNIHEPRNAGQRPQQPSTSGPHIRGPRTSMSQPQVQQQPHPSIFDHRSESNLTQMRAKVPSLTDNIEYFGYKPKEVVPKRKPFIGCRFKLIEYTTIDPEIVEKWRDVIKKTGGTFSDDLNDITHLICETRLTDLYSEAIKKGIRCITVYWINDVLELDRLLYPWKPLHIPLPFSTKTRPLGLEKISITNFKGSERALVREMLKKTSAIFTEHFSMENTLLICADNKGTKYEKALQWRIPIVNYLFLCDILLEGDKDVNQMLEQSKYTIINSDSGTRIGSYASIRDVMAPWTKPLLASAQTQPSNPPITNGTPTEDTNNILNANEDSGMATGGSNNSEGDLARNTANNNPKLLEETPRSPAILLDKQAEENAGSTNLNVNATMIENNNTDLDPDRVVKGIEEESASNRTDDVAKVSIDVIMETDHDKANHEISSGEIDKGATFPMEVAAADKPKIDSNSVEDSKQTTKPIRESTEPIRLLFTHMDAELTSKLQSCALKLGLSMASSPIDCTHLVVNRISRTPKFICAFSHASYILSHRWLLESFDVGQVLDEKQFILQDPKGEEQFSFNLVYSLLKRKKRSSLLFNNIVFFVTPTISAKVKFLKEMIESAGGNISTRKPPTRAQIDQMRSDGKRLVVVSSQQDLYLCSSLVSLDVPIVGYEFVISGILRQDIDFDAHRVKCSSQSVSQSETSLAQVRSPKRVRHD